MKNWMDMDSTELAAALKELGEPAFRAKQVYSWLVKGVDFDEMANIPKALREKLRAARPLGGVKVLERLVSKIDGTVKYLFLLEDRNIVEGVLMRYHYGNTLCISTQVGCRMGCTFCASTLNGLVRNLTPGEMLSCVAVVNREQLQQQRKGDTDERGVTNIVLMGSGEPLDNYDNVIEFLRLVNLKDGLNISHRNISLSTCGLVDKIYDLVETGLNVTLCISLHAPNDEMRRSIMPIAKKYSIDQIIEAVRAYVEKTGRRAIFEYSLIEGVNDTMACAKELCARLRGLLCHVNLIPLNSVKERNLNGTSAQNARRFMEALNSMNTSATIRRELGSDIDGACGQLRRRYLEEHKQEEEC